MELTPLLTIPLYISIQKCSCGGFFLDNALTPVTYSSMSIDEICQYVDCYVTNGEMASRLIGLIRNGHGCRNALLSLNSYFLEHKKLIEDYDYFWLGVTN